MSDRSKRFTCIREPTGTWAVIDGDTGKAATLDGKLLVGRDQMNAEAACGILRRIYETGLQNKAPENRRA